MADNAAADANITRWEYRTLTRKTEEYLVDDLNEAGGDGWDLVTIEFHRDPAGMGDSMCWTAFLKRSYVGQRRVALTHEQVQADEKAKKQKFTSATLDDSEPEFTFQGEIQPRVQPFDSPINLQSDDGGLKIEGDDGGLKLEGDDGGLKLEGDDGGLKLEGDDDGEFRLQGDAPPEQSTEDELADVEIIEDVEIIDDDDKPAG